MSGLLHQAAMTAAIVLIALCGDAQAAGPEQRGARQAEPPSETDTFAGVASRLSPVLGARVVVPDGAGGRRIHVPARKQQSRDDAHSVLSDLVHVDVRSPDGDQTIYLVGPRADVRREVSARSRRTTDRRWNGLTSVSVDVRKGAVDDALSKIEREALASLRSGQSTDLIVVLSADAASDVLGAYARGTPSYLEALAVSNRALTDAVMSEIPSGRRGAVSQHRYSHVLSFRSDSLDEVMELARLNVVHSVVLDRQVGPRFETQLAQIDQPLAFDAGKRGSGAIVAVLDTGVDYLWPGNTIFGNCDPAADPRESLFLGSECRVVAAIDTASTNDAKRDADERVRSTLVTPGHGTMAAAGVLAVAPDAQIIAIDVFDVRADRKTSTSSIVRGLEEVLAAVTLAGYNVVAVNMSIGSENGSCSPGPYTAIVSELIAAGVAVVAAAGNDGLDAVSAPACVPGVISVGAVNDKDARIWYSNYGQDLDLWAPSEYRIESALPLDPGGAFSSHFTGTSAAAPIVAGAIAALAGNDAFPNLTPVEIEQLLKRTGVPVSDLPNRSARRINLAAALELIGRPYLVSASDGQSLDKVEVTWSGPEGSRYRVDRSLPGGSSSMVLGHTTNQSWSDLTAEPGVRYLYTISIDNIDSQPGPPVSDEGFRGVGVASGLYQGLDITEGGNPGYPFHYIFRRQDGIAFAWGGNRFGQLGDATVISRLVARPVLGSDLRPFSPTLQLLSDGRVSFATTVNGDLYSWGDNTFGKLFDGTTVPYRAVPGRIGTGIEQFDFSGDNILVALTRGGAIREYRRDIAVGPYDVPQTGVVEVATGCIGRVFLRTADGLVRSYFRQALTPSGGSDMCAGRVITPSNFSTPGVVGCPTGGGFQALNFVTQVEAGSTAAFALRRVAGTGTGQVFAWGFNTLGQFGISPSQVEFSACPLAVPAGVFGGFSNTNVIQIAAGREHVLALDADGTVWSWGYNNYGQLGTGAPGLVPQPGQFSATPAPVLDASGARLTGIVHVSASDYGSLAVRPDGSVFTWGLGQGNMTCPGFANSSETLSPCRSFAGPLQLPQQLPDGTSVTTDASFALPSASLRVTPEVIVADIERQPPVEIFATIANDGLDVAKSVTVTVSASPAFTGGSSMSVIVAGVGNAFAPDCTVSLDSVTCELGDVAPGTAVVLPVRFDAAGGGDTWVSVEAASQVPQDPAWAGLERASVLVELDTDLDSDFVADARDNCSDVANSGQEDNDADGIGDACEQSATPSSSGGGGGGGAFDLWALLGFACVAGLRLCRQRRPHHRSADPVRLAGGVCQELSVERHTVPEYHILCELPTSCRR